MNWTKPYCGVTHLGNNLRGYRLTVSDYGTFATLTRWYPGCAFHPLSSDHNTVKAAKETEEAWLKEVAHNQTIATEGIVSAINTRKDNGYLC